ncbi:transcription antitermination protein NusB [Salinimicrobium sp. MT39]|uniref:Transcription antitermination protein NusB n=1 Tax=Salinimicrobium profundisediminis TaxID=2994553 RepID=A0A9X3I132_9FLAO|nr:transcription antitermination protein NusB [Salinimicrobium profundisediminis]MCX2837532.1 transcription antitermination protein NusB [Salinimicrobium profundisediminis]
MLTRRHIRVKVMQSLYAYSQSENDNLKAEEKFLLKSMDEMYDLYLLLLDLIVEIKDHAEDYLEKSQQKHLPSEEDVDPNRKFVNNELIAQLKQNRSLNIELETRKLNNWKNDDEYVEILWAEIRNSDRYREYMTTRTSSFREDKEFVIAIFREIIAPNEKLYDYLEDKKITWVDDLPLVNTAIVKMLQKASEGKDQALTRLFKSSDDKDYAVELFRKTLLNDSSLAQEMEGKTPNWDKERIADLDTILIKMAICEFLKFPSIPVKVTINEYLEVAKEYSTPKSSIFINGVLDKLSKEYSDNNKLNKMGRGLM